MNCNDDMLYIWFFSNKLDLIRATSDFSKIDYRGHHRKVVAICNGTLVNLQQKLGFLKH
jgi:hypothetical protein